MTQKTTFGIEIAEPQVEMFLPEEYGHDMWLLNARPEELAENLVQRNLIKCDEETVDGRVWYMFSDPNNGELVADAILHICGMAYANGIDLQKELIERFEELTS